ncbi:hypothetical protein BJ322DRAFT_1023896 [Thelephora terrestris]|uniref:Zona occludens toxin N-terminal domain-containing protein n=1 Tax=Thelephora terrestris TaxID=56493 RepID=A0A9P6H8L7_9AGAM|nr:hypothetical protein BJ322DRAFT_1023896 [Thelephora terrestris]
MSPMHLPSAPSPSSTNTGRTTPVDGVVSCPAEFSLLGNKTPADLLNSSKHQLVTAPLFSRKAYELCEANNDCQYGVLGTILEIGGQEDESAPEDPRLYLNTNAPFSAVVCGVQGSGKSHSVSVMLESMMIPGFDAIGCQKKALSGLVLHFGEAGTVTQPCEAAYLGLSRLEGFKTPKIRVYVTPTSLSKMTAVYKRLGPSVEVSSLLLTQSELDAKSFLSLMAVGTTSTDRTPLYMKIILMILRDLGVDGFSYIKFKTALDKVKKKFNPEQLSGLEQRMLLLESFLEKGTKRTWVETRFDEGQLTIVDLTDPFVDAGHANALFEIVTRLFERAVVDTGKVLVVDEAHKYLTEGTPLVNTLMTMTRELRHTGIRIIISTQEPTCVPPVLLDLCGVAIMHRFSSPAWWDHVAKHFSGRFTVGRIPAFDRVVTLQTGEAIILAPSAFTTSVSPLDGSAVLRPLGRQYFVARTRDRVTKDGGASILVI